MAVPLRSAESMIGNAKRKSVDSPQSTTVCAPLVTGIPLTYSGAQCGTNTRLILALFALVPCDAVAMVTEPA